MAEARRPRRSDGSDTPHAVLDVRERRAFERATSSGRRHSPAGSSNFACRGW